MNRVWWLVVSVALLVSSPAQGQLRLSLRLLTEDPLLYERIPAQVTLRNVSGQTLVLGGTESEPWLSFLITDESGRAVDALGDIQDPQTLVLRSGESATREIDLLRAYDLRALGTYRVQAVVKTSGLRGWSDRQRLIITAGNEIARQTVGLPPGPESGQQRTYTLIVKRAQPHYRIYLRVADEPHGLVYAMFPVGTYVPMGEPVLRTDAQSHLHLLIRSGARAFQYRHVDTNGKIVSEAAYSDLQSSPRLVAADDGIVSVQGGEQVYPHIPRPPSPEPPEPEPPPPPQKPWWKFWDQ